MAAVLRRGIVRKNALFSLLGAVGVKPLNQRELQTGGLWNAKICGEHHNALC
jgi:hypothetical protein